MQEEAFIARFPLCIQDQVRRDLMAGMIDVDDFDLAVLVSPAEASDSPSF